MSTTIIESEARRLIHERVTRARAPHLPPVPRRHRLASRLRSVADRLDG